MDFAANFHQRSGGPCLYHDFFGKLADKCREPCSWAGNGGAGAAVAAVSAGSLTLHDATSNRNFLVDTGAEVSVVPASEEERQRAPMQKQLVAANGTRIRCYGEKENCDCRSVPEDTSGSF